MTQSRKTSLIESIVNMVVGQVVAVLLWMHVVAPVVAPQHDTLIDGFVVNAIFMVASIVRGYIIRRIFAGLEQKRRYEL